MSYLFIGLLLTLIALVAGAKILDISVEDIDRETLPLIGVYTLAMIFAWPVILPVTLLWVGYLALSSQLP